MAYKVQIGDARLEGSITQAGQISASAEQVTGSAATVTTAVTMDLGSAAPVQLKFTQNDAGKLVSSNTINIDAGGSRLFRENTDAGALAVADENANFGSRDLIDIDIDNTSTQHGGRLTLRNYKSDSPAALSVNVQIDGHAGTVSGSSFIAISEEATISGSLTINGDLTITGTGGDDNVALGDANTDSFTVEDRIILIADGQANGANTRLRLGQPGVNNRGGMIEFQDTLTGYGQAFIAKDGNSSTEIAISASAYFADGSGLTSVPGSTTPKYAYTSHTGAGNLVVGYNLLTYGGTALDMTLPGSPSAGDVIRLHIDGAASAAQPVTVLKGHADQRIDGVESFKIESPNASVELVYLGDSTNAFGHNSNKNWVII